MNDFDLSRTVSERPVDRNAMEHPTQPVRILLLDDDPVLARLMALLLMRGGYQVDTAGDGEQGWAALRRGHYDLLMTDNDMPRLKGLDLARRVRAAGMALPIIVVSASEEARVLVDDGSLFLAAVVSKPFDPEDLLAKVGRTVACGAATASGAFAA